MLVGFWLYFVVCLFGFFTRASIRVETPIREVPTPYEGIHPVWPEIEDPGDSWLRACHSTGTGTSRRRGGTLQHIEIASAILRNEGGGFSL